MTTHAEVPTAAPFVPKGADLETLKKAAADCRGCDLYKQATQTVFGDGAPDARMVFVGEQPGDVEDQQGRPFVGPAGKVFDRALEEIGIDRATTYVTNAVKHFSFTGGNGKRRIHKTPDTVAINACKPWLVAELTVIDPEVVVALGATATRALLGTTVKVMRDRGKLMPWPPRGPLDEASTQSGFVMVTIHPSAVLRADNRDEAYAGLVADLKIAAEVLG
ncbi:MAG: uracil-DNA glycosylase [Frankiales bacterium]|nr:uracil-DNA glycosylase [Frankiales bacterium]